MRNPYRYKSRWVAKGFLQTEGEDFLETYSPVGIIAMFGFSSIEKKPQLETIGCQNCILELRS